MSQPYFRTRLTVGFALLPLLWAADVSSEVRRLEVVGATAIHDERRQRLTPKDRAIQEGLQNAVSRVAADILLEDLILGRDAVSDSPNGGLPDMLQGTPLAWQSPFEALEPARELEPRKVRQALGADMLPYTKKFRIIEDQEERPSLFTYHPDAATEYVLVMEVQVEVDRIRQRLEEVGLLDPRRSQALEGIELELLGVRHYPLYQAVLDLLALPSINAAAVTTESFESNRVQLRVEGEWSASELSSRLHAAAPADIGIETVGVDDGLAKAGLWDWAPTPRPKLSVAIRWTPGSEDDRGEGEEFPTGVSGAESRVQAEGLGRGLSENLGKTAPD